MGVFPDEDGHGGEDQVGREVPLLMIRRAPKTSDRATIGSNLGSGATGMSHRTRESRATADAPRISVRSAVSQPQGCTIRRWHEVHPDDRLGASTSPQGLPVCGSGERRYQRRAYGEDGEG